MNVRTRMAPSPTGWCSIGTAHTAFFNYLLAKHNGGVFIYRDDDTDLDRSTDDYRQDLIASLHWLGLHWDEGPDIGGPYAPYSQSQRGDIYKRYIAKLLQEKWAYRCFCTPEELEAEKQAAHQRGDKQYLYSGKCKNLTENEVNQLLKTNQTFTIRMRTDFLETIVIEDLIRGHVEVKATDIGDFIIVRSDGSPVLPLTATVDDIEMKVTHAIRGEDMLNMSFRMAFIFKTLDQPMPHYAHKPFMYSANGSKLSKRHGATAVHEFQQQGYLPEAILNYLFFVGYTPANDQKAFYSLEEMVADFDFSHFQKGMPRFDYQKLLWYNGEYIRQLTPEQLTERLESFVPADADQEIIKQLVPLTKERMKLLSDFKSLTNFIFTEPQIPTTWKPLAKEHLEAILQILQSIEVSQWTSEFLNQQFIQLIADHQWKTGDFFMNLRLAIAGQPITPPITECVIILGKEKAIERIERTLNVIAST